MRQWLILASAFAVPVAAGAQPSLQELAGPVDLARVVTIAPSASLTPMNALAQGGFRAQRGNDPVWDGALKGFAVGSGALLALYAYAWKHEGEPPTVTSPGGLVGAVGVLGGIGALIGVAVDHRQSQTMVLRPLLSKRGAGAVMSVSW